MDFEMLEIEKSLQERIKEYADIYTNYGYEEVDDFYKMWSSYLIASSMESAGWRAYWKLSKTSCFEYDVHFSCSFFVMVNQVDYTTLSAEIELVDEEESRRFNLPCKLLAPLIDLYITKDQDDSILFATATADCLDQLRIFYKYLWWPWDADASESTNWFSKNLQPRLKLYNDIMSGNYSEPVTKKVKTLIEKGKYFYNVYLKESESIPPDDKADSETMRKIVEYVRNIEQIKASLELFTEDSRWKTRVKQDSVNSGAFLVVSESNLEKMIKCTHVIAESYCAVKLKQIMKEVENALSQYENYDIIFLSPGKHFMGSECLNANVTIRNSTQEKSTICGGSPFWYFLKMTADNISLQNLIICSRENLVLIYVKEGVTCIDSITMLSSGTKRQRAIVVGENAILVANKCQFNDFSTAIICLPGSAVQLSDCVFQNNYVAIEVVGDAQVCLKNVTGLQSGKVFVKYEGDIPSNEFNPQPLEKLSRVATINLECVKVDNEEYAVQFV